MLVADLGEIRPSILRPVGTVFLAGAAGTAAIYDTNTKIWTKGFDFPINPSGYICHPQDGPGTLLPNRNVLLACPGGFGTPACGFQNGPV